MGTSSSFNERTKNSVHENMLASTLSGDVTGDDYLAISHKALTELEEQKPDNKFTGAETFMDIGNAFMMLEEGLQPLEQGFHRKSDGCWYIACLTDLGTECTGEMFDWWLRNCTDAERFKCGILETMYLATGILSFLLSSQRIGTRGTTSTTVTRHRY